MWAEDVLSKGGHSKDAIKALYMHHDPMLESRDQWFKDLYKKA